MVAGVSQARSAEDHQNPSIASYFDPLWVAQMVFSQMVFRKSIAVLPVRWSKMRSSFTRVPMHSGSRGKCRSAALQPLLSGALLVRIFLRARLPQAAHKLTW